MKKLIIQLGKKYRLSLNIKIVRESYDIWGYEISEKDGSFICYHSYSTGKTNTGIIYPSDKEETLMCIEEDFKKYKLIHN